MVRPLVMLPLVVALLGHPGPAIRAQVATPPATAATALPTGPATVTWQTTGGPNLPFDDPFQLTLDPAGNVWVADGRNSRFQIFAPDGSFLETWGTPGDGDGQFNFIDLLGYPTGGVAFDADGNLYVADSGNHRIQKFDADRHLVMAWGGPGSADGAFQGSLGIVSSPDGRLYVSDYERKDVQVFDGDGTFRFRFGGRGPGEVPIGVYGSMAFAADGTLYVADHDRDGIAHVAPDGTVLAAWGSTGSAAGQFNSPYSVAVDAGGRLYVTDHDNHRVQVLTDAGDVLGSWGRASGMPFGSAEPGEFSGPVGIAMAADGSVYVGEFGNDRVQQVRPFPALTPGATPMP